MTTHTFKGKWITNSEFSKLPPRNVFHRQLEKVDLPCDNHRNRHILFRKKFVLNKKAENALIHISADDYYKLYINGNFVAQGPTASYHFNYNYNTINVTNYLKTGENVIAVHTLYQGLINRVWQSGDNRHGLILDLCVNGETLVSSDETFKTHPHTAYTETGVCGYDTQFLERYDSNANEVNFALLDFDDSYWENAEFNQYDDHKLTPQKSKMLEFENVLPKRIETFSNKIRYDFGAVYVGYLKVLAKGKTGDRVVVKCAQELNDDGSIRSNLRANLNYSEEWILSDDLSVLDWFDYKAFRYAEIEIPESCEIKEVQLIARHYPFDLKTDIKEEFSKNEELLKIWNLCVNTQKYGVQEVIQDCMEREKGFYLGDGCYTALTNMILTKDDSMVRKLIDDAFATNFITDTLVTCMCCSFMQEIAEYPLILVSLVLWHYKFTGDREYLFENYAKVKKLLEAYHQNYEQDYLLRNLDKWSVVEWPKNFQHGYDVDITEGKVCKDAHVAINAYYIEAIRNANEMASILNLPCYRDEKELLQAFNAAFFNSDKKLFKDGENTKHISLVGNSFVYGFALCENKEFKENFLDMFKQNGIHSLSLFCSFILLEGFVKNERYDLIKEAILDEEAWLRMLREGATTTFEGWGKDTKWNTSLFHLTMSYVAVFMADVDIKKILSKD